MKKQAHKKPSAQSTEPKKMIDGGNDFQSPVRFARADELYARFQIVSSIRGTGKSFANIIGQYERKPYTNDGRILPNFGTLRGKVDKALGNYVDFITERERWASVETDHDPENAYQGMWGELIAELFQKYCLKRWEKSFSENTLAVRDMLLMSKGSFLWDDDESCYPKRISIQHVMPDSQANMFPDSFDIVFIRQSMSAVELFRKISGDEANIVGWNKKAVLNILKNMDSSMKNADHDSIFLKYKSCAVSQQQQDTRIDMIWAFVQEFRGGENDKSVSHFIIPATMVTAPRGRGMIGGGTKLKDTIDYLYYLPNKYECMDEAIGILAHNVCENFYEDPSFAQLIYTFSKTYDMVMNRVLQAIEDNMRVYLRASSPEVMKKIQRMRHGNFQVLDPDVKLEQERIVRPVMESLQVLQKLNIDNNDSNGQYTIGEQSNHAMPKTAKQSVIDFDESQKSSTSQMKLFNCYFGLMLSQIYRKFVTLGSENKLCKCEQKNFDAFKKMLKAKKVPDAAWSIDNVTVSSVYLSGAGSPQERIRGAQIIQSALTMPAASKGELLVKRNIVAAVAGVSMVDSYIPPDQDMAIPEDSLIGLENDALSQASANPNNTPVNGDQLHMRHIPRHIQDAGLSMQMAGKILQGIDQMPAQDKGIYIKTIQDILIGIDNKLGHAQAHVQLAEQGASAGNKAQLKQWAMQINQINDAQDKLEGAISQMQMARAKDQPQSTEPPEVAHKRAMFQMEEEHTAKMLDFQFNKEGMKAEQLRNQSADNAIHSKQLETVLAGYDLQMKQMKGSVDLLMAAKKAAAKT